MDRRLRSALMSLLALGSGVALTWYANSIFSLDAFARFRTKPGVPLDPISIHLNDLDIRQWTGGKLMTFAHVGEMNVGRNQNFYEMFHVTRGVYNGAEEPFDFDAAHATWTPSRQVLEGFQDIRVRNARYDFHGTGFTFEVARKLMTVSGDVDGTFEGSKIKTRGVTYDENLDELKTGPVEIQTESKDDDTHHVWHISAAGGTVTDGKRHTQTMLDVRATDGTIIIKAPKGVRNTQTDVLTCDGPVRYWSPKADGICDHAVIYRKEKRAVLSGRVTMVLKPKDHQVVDEKIEIVPFTPLKPEDVAVDKPLAPSFEHAPIKAADSKADPAQKLLDKANSGKGGQSPEFDSPDGGQAPANPQAPVKQPAPAKPIQKPIATTGETAEQRKQLDDDLRSNESIRKYPATIYAEKIDYYYAKGQRHAIITGSPQAQQELPGKRWRRVWAHHALYDGEKETLRLMTADKDLDVRVKTSVGDDFQTDFFLISTEEGNDDSSSGKTVGDYVSEDEESNNAVTKAGQKDKPTKPPTKPPGSGG